MKRYMICGIARLLVPASMPTEKPTPHRNVFIISYYLVNEDLPHVDNTYDA